jgi:hypothetical protein
MLAWLHVAFSHEVEVEKSLDTTEGVVTALPDGRCWISEVILKPRITFNWQQQVVASTIAHFHDLTQCDCFIITAYCVEKTLPGSRITRDGGCLFGQIAACRGARNAQPLPNRNRNPRL